MSIKRTMMVGILATLLGIPMVHAQWLKIGGGSIGFETLPKIQDLIDNAISGDTIQLSAGSYTETVQISKPLTLTSKDKQNTIIQSIVSIKNTSHVILKDITIGQIDTSGWYAPSLTIDSSQNISLINVTVSGTSPIMHGEWFGMDGRCGIQISNSNDIDFRKVTIVGGSGGEGSTSGGMPGSGGNGGTGMVVVKTLLLIIDSSYMAGGVGGAGAYSSYGRGSSGNNGYSFSTTNSSSVSISNSTFRNAYTVDSSSSLIISNCTDVKNNCNNVAKAFLLDQNYPNPFNPSTTIPFSLPFRSAVSLKIFDILGKEIVTLYSGELSAGTYTHRWNAINLPSGVYFYRLQAGSFTQTKKLLLLK